MLSVAHRWLTPVNQDSETIKLKHWTNDNKNIQQENINISSLRLLYLIVGLIYKCAQRIRGTFQDGDMASSSFIDTSNGCMFHSLSTIICFARSNPHWCICEISQWWEISSAVSVWLQNYNHALSELLYKQKINRTPSAEDVKSYFVVLYLFNFIVKITQKCNKARSEPGFRQQKSFVSEQHFQNRYYVRKQQLTKGVFGWILL